MGKACFDGPRQFALTRLQTHFPNCDIRDVLRYVVKRHLKYWRDSLRPETRPKSNVGNRGRISADAQVSQHWKTNP
jgi:hypothetical protein